MLLLVALLAVLCGQEAQAYYNPSTGRWLNRDPSGEDGGLNLHCAMLNDQINGIDPLGLKTIALRITRDRTLAGAYWGRKVFEATTRAKAIFEQVLKECVGGCEYANLPTVIVHLMLDDPLPAPPDRIWDIGSLGNLMDRPLAVQNIQAIKKKGAGVPIFWTETTIRSRDKNGNITTLSGITLAGDTKGIILSWGSFIMFQENVLAHEIGHYAEYNGGDIEDGTHSSNPENIMAKGKNGISPDQNYCVKVEALAE
jgi:hypothetical protein